LESQTKLKSAVETVQLKDENFKNLSILKKSEINPLFIIQIMQAVRQIQQILFKNYQLCSK